MDELALQSLDLWSPAFREDPYPTLDLMRTLRPRLAVPHEGGCDWHFTRHDDVSMVLKDPRFIKEGSRLLNHGQAPVPESEETRNPLYKMFDNWMLFRDPPDHTRLRSLVNQAFTPRVVERLRPRISEIAQGLLSPLQGTEDFDLISAYAFPLPVIVIAELLGVPAADREQFRIWSTAVARTLELGEVPEDLKQAGGQMAAEVQDYFRRLVREREVSPRDDLLSGLIAVRVEGSRLTEDEMLATCVLLLFAGHETTVNLIGNSVHLLLRDRETYSRLVADRTLLASAVEECLRYESPVQLTNRFAAEDMEIGGDQLHRGDNIIVWLNAANRDPQVFDDPNRFDIARHPNRHLAFAAGPHFCIGAPLARLEGELALAALMDLYPALRASSDPITWRPSGVFRGPVRLSVQTR